MLESLLRSADGVQELYSTNIISAVRFNLVRFVLCANVISAVRYEMVPLVIGPNVISAVRFELVKI